MKVNYPANWLILAGLIVMAGRWTRGETIRPSAVVALFIVALAVTVMSTVDEDIANGLSILTLVAVTYEYAGDILRALNKAVSQ